MRQYIVTLKKDNTKYQISESDLLEIFDKEVNAYFLSMKSLVSAEIRSKEYGVVEIRRVSCE